MWEVTGESVVGWGRFARKPFSGIELLYTTHPAS
jgi:hypothetical protein